MMIGASAAASMAAGPAVAQPAAQPAWPTQADGVVTFNIPPQSLAGAVTAFGLQSGYQVSADQGTLAGVQSPGVAGAHTPLVALQRLLAGTAVTWRQVGARAVALEKAPAAAGGAINLGAVRVEGEGRSVNDAYAIQADGSATQGYRSDSAVAVGPWRGRALLDTPYTVTVVPRELIENLQATSPEQIYRVAPTAQLGESSYRNDEPSIYMRGFLVYIPYRDGVPGDHYGFGTTTEDVERIEIFSGLSGFIYGPGNVGGMVNYVAKRPTPERLDRVTLGSNGGENLYAHVDLGGPIDREGRFGYRLNGMLQDGETAVDNMKIGKDFVSAAFDWNAAPGLLLQVDAAYRNYEVYGGQTLWRLAAGVTRPSASAIDDEVSWAQPWQFSQNRTWRYGAQARWDANETLSLRAAWQHAKTTRLSTMGNTNIIQKNGTFNQSIFGVYAPGDNPFNFETSTSSVQVFADVNFETGSVVHKLTTGVQYQERKRWDSVNTPPTVAYTGLTLDRPTYFAKPVQPHVDTTPRILGSDYASGSFLVGDDVTFNDHFSLLAGAAYSTIENKPNFYTPTVKYKKSAITPNLSLIYRPVDAVTTYATYIEALEQGGVAGRDFNGLPVLNAGEVFEPLISKQIEVGAKTRVGGMLLTAAVFEIDKALQYYDVSNPAGVRFVQDGRQVHRGVELTAFGKVTDDLTLTGGLTLLDAEIREQKQTPALEGKRPPSVADTLVKLRAEYRLPFLPALSFSGGVIHAGDQYGDALNADRIAGYTVFDLGARYEFEIASRPVTLRLDVNNVADKAYWVQNVTLGAPRTILLSASAQF